MKELVEQVTPATPVARQSRRLPDSLFVLGMMQASCPEMSEPQFYLSEIDLHHHDPAKLSQIATEALAYLESDRCRRTYQLIAEKARLATKEEIKRELQVLVGSFPNASKANLEVYGRALALDIIDDQPCIEALVVGCKALRQVSKFLPTISEVLAWTRGVGEVVMRDRDVLAALPAAVERAGQGAAPPPGTFPSGF